MGETAARQYDSGHSTDGLGYMPDKLLGRSSLMNDEAKAVRPADFSQQIQEGRSTWSTAGLRSEKTADEPNQEADMGQWALVALIGLALGAGIFLAVPGKIRGGIVLTMLVGAIAALTMTWIGAQLGIATQGSTIAFFFAVIGTGLVLAVWRVTMNRA